jgi:ribonuclease VapC
MFVDASAIVAILSDEPDIELYKSAIRQSESVIVTSPLALFEASLALLRKGIVPLDGVAQLIHGWLKATGILVEPIKPEFFDLALLAHARLGKGRGHPAQLNFGDCFASAAAKSLGIALLFKGEDFSKTDVLSALR